MKKKHLLGLLMATFLPLTALSQDDTQPKVSATGSYINADKESKESNNIDDGDAPLEDVVKAAIRIAKEAAAAASTPERRSRARHTTSSTSTTQTIRRVSA